MGNIGSHVDLTSGRRRHQANAEAEGAFQQNWCYWAVVASYRGPGDDIASPCAVFASYETWQILKRYPIEDHRQFTSNRAFCIGQLNSKRPLWNTRFTRLQ